MIAADTIYRDNIFAGESQIGKPGFGVVQKVVMKIKFSFISAFVDDSIYRGLPGFPIETLQQVCKIDFGGLRVHLCALFGQTVSFFVSSDSQMSRDPEKINLSLAVFDHIKLFFYF